MKDSKLRVLLSTNIPSPYMVAYLNELGKYCDLTAVFELRSALDRESSWYGKAEGLSFNAVFLNALRTGADEGLSFKLLRYLSPKKYDRIIIADACTPTGVAALLYCRWLRVPFILQSEGGFQGSGKGLKEAFKKYIMKKAQFYLTGMRLKDDYYLRYGATWDELRPYPFTSMYAAEIEASAPDKERKAALRRKLNINEAAVILSVGRIIPGKGIDVLLHAYALTDRSVGLYIIGGKPEDEHRRIIEENGLDKVHFVEFMPPEELKEYYLAADFFVLATREDTWGLVINEAMANGLPVITTDRCNAGLKLIEDGVNGYLVPVDDVAALRAAMERLAGDEELRALMAKNCIEKIQDYSIENMARTIAGYLGCI